LPQRSIQVLLAAILAMWSPIWCCCASQQPADSLQASSLEYPHATTACSHCPPQSSSSEPAGNNSHQRPKHKCPHSSLRTLAQIAKAPQTQAIAVSLDLALSDHDSWVVPTSLDSPLSLAQNQPPNIGTRTLVAMSCQLSI